MPKTIHPKTIHLMAVAFILIVVALLLLPLVMGFGVVTDYGSETQYTTSKSGNTYSFRVQNNENYSLNIILEVESDLNIAELEHTEYILPPYSTTGFSIFYSFPENSIYGDYAEIRFTVRADSGQSGGTGASVNKAITSSFTAILGETAQEKLHRITDTSSEQDSGGNGGSNTGGGSENTGGSGSVNIGGGSAVTEENTTMNITLPNKTIEIDIDSVEKVNQAYAEKINESQHSIMPLLQLLGIIIVAGVILFLLRIFL